MPDATESGRKGHHIVEWVLPIVSTALAALAYYGVNSIPVLLAVAMVAAALLSWPERANLSLLDWAMLLVLLYELPSLLLSRYPANGAPAARIVCNAVMYYLLARLATRTTRQTVIVSLLAGVGGLWLAWFALPRAIEQIGALDAHGFSTVVAFRSLLIVPPAPWVLGEWFTLVLLTLPFALAACVFCSLGKQRSFSVGAAVIPLLIAAALFLSCSRAVFVGVAVFIIATASLAAVYRVLWPRIATALGVGALSVLAALLVAENVIYPGIMAAYTGQHTSQTRSTEGRLAIWKRSMDVFVLSPWWGVGSGNAPLFLTSSASEEETTGFASRTFSLPIQVLTEKGAVGAALYLAVLVLAGWEAHRKLRSPKTSLQMKGMTCCFAAGVIAVLSRELAYASLLEHAATAMLFTMCLALLVAPEEA
jgi:O-antigen ligase